VQEEFETLWDLIQPLFDEYGANVMGMNIKYHRNLNPILVELNGVKVGEIHKIEGGYKLVTETAFGSLQVECGESNEEKLKLSTEINRVCSMFVLGIIKLK
jgi:hypothetical protein